VATRVRCKPISQSVTAMTGHIIYSPSVSLADLPIITIYPKNRQKVTVVIYVVCIEMFQYIMLLLMCIQFELSFFNGDFI